jgi:class 3 adenylate cyclase
MVSDPSRFVSQPVVILVSELNGFAKAFQARPDDVMADFLDRFYRLAESVLQTHGGRIIKFIGDSVLAVFPVTHAPQAIAAAAALERESGSLLAELGKTASFGANLHMGPAVEAELGDGPSRRRDIVGKAVNQTFMLGKGPGIRISEPVYRKLPSAERTPWEKKKPSAVYVLGVGGEPYAGLHKTESENTTRW